MEVINPLKAVKAIDTPCVYKKIAKFNQNVMSVVNVENRTLDFHVHEKSDELFMVLEGGFFIETDEGLTRVNEGEFIIVPKGVRHRPVVHEFSRFLLIEIDGTLNKENSGELYKD